MHDYSKINAYLPYHIQKIRVPSISIISFLVEQIAKDLIIMSIALLLKLRYLHNHIYTYLQRKE